MMQEKGDFSTEFRLVWIAALAVVIGAICSVIAQALLWLIALFTNLFYYHEVSVVFRSPAAAAESLDLLGVLIPVVGGLLIGLMARYGSERIRGHGIPEAIEAILIGQSRMQPKVAVLKPLSSAISIGSGGPFGAEGPIIMTGGAIGSIIAQAFHLSAAERKTLLVAGAAGGMTATFGTPVAAVLLAVELLLFEWKPRSFIPVALASATAAVIRPYLLGTPPLFQVALHHDPLGIDALLFAIPVGLVAGMLALLLTLAVYAMEDLFHRLPIHWMWWPALGGLVVGIGGYFEPRALGVGYEVIESLLKEKVVLAVLVPLMLVKCWIWATSLGSGTSGGVLAPLLMMGGALGAMEAGVADRLGLAVGADRPLWALVGMAAVLGGTMRSPLTGAIFALELTYDMNVLPALLIASVLAHGFTVLLMRRSILTEKIARRGYHVSREYTVDPLELLSIAEVMSTDLVTIPASQPLREVLRQYFQGSGDRRHQGYPIVDGDGSVLGVITRRNLLEEWVSRALTTAEAEGGSAEGPIIAYDLVARKPITAFPWESCRVAAGRMAQLGVGRLLVVSPEDPKKLVGIVTRSDLLKPRAKHVEEEVRRERFLATGLVPPRTPAGEGP